MSEPTFAAIYARISQDDAGTEKGVARQLEDCRQLADLRGFEVVGEYVENDVSAFSHRPEYERLMADVAAGGIDVVVVYSTSRLWRNRTQRGAAIDTLGRLGVRIEAVSGPSLDLGNATGRYLADVIAGGDTRESEEKGERVARAARQRAEEGRANGVCPYGWRRVYEYDARGQVVGFHDVEDPDAAKVVREIVERIAAGDSVRGIARDLTDRGVPSPTGKERWGHTTVRRLALRPGNIAKRVHKGEVIGDAAWPAIVDADAYEAATRRLEEKGGNPFASVEAKPEHLLTGKSGAGRCGVCGAELRLARKRSKRKRGPDKVYALYCCNDSGCVGRDQGSVDHLVGEVVVGLLARPDAAAAFLPPVLDPEGAQARATEARRKLDEAGSMFAEGVIDRQQLSVITAKLRPVIEEAEREVRRAQAPPTPPPIDLERLGGEPGELADLWGSLPLERRRRVLEALSLRVRIMPTQQGGRGFDPSDVVVERVAD